ncbi:putative virulence-associated protein E [Roseibium sp. TrichSKD4]|uniref:virulence-associated protein E n=1 Tax=Roseibium sp. TrichSKD4 TaxID=744980 RepID=UPI0001E56241|nr:virulence-associated protein E [Roseibium sp. TrichSKD4]EFO33800.1 putative virulence-associated protein E [Roseibium sp. TrichSKD4]
MLSQTWKGLGPCAEKGGAIRLFQTDGCTTIGACEGVESGYGAWNIAGREFPIWPMMSTSGMKRFIPPFEVERIVGFPDGDIEFDDHKKTWREPPGQKAWLSLESRVQEEGIVTGMNPTEWNRTDPLDNWNDFYERFGGVAA